MHRLSSLLLSATVFLIAVASVTLLSRAPFGEIYATLLSIGEETEAASITLYGATKPEVNLTVATKDAHTVYAILSMTDPSSEELTLTVPGDWHLEEARGAHASDIAEYGGTERLTLIVPMRERAIELRFTLKNAFASVAFSHDGDSPALFTLTQLDLPGRKTTKKVQLVENAGTVEM